jgi:capsular exopolysaccharide synthesis family protein
MSRIFEALQQSNAEAGRTLTQRPVPADPGAQAGPSAPVTDGAAFDQCSAFSISAPPQHRLVTLHDPSSLGAEKIRLLATRLRHLRQKRPLSRLLVTSSIKGEGKSVISVNLAVAMANDGRQRTLLIDGDFRKPSVCRLLGLSDTPGVGDWWRSDTSMTTLIRRCNGLPLWVLPAGHISEQPVDILHSQRVVDLLARLSESFHWIVIDSPPLGPLADSTVWGNLVDGIILVVRQGLTPTKAFGQVVETIDRSKLVGVVLNGSTAVEHRYYDQYYRRGREQPQKSNGTKD